MSLFPAVLSNVTEIAGKPSNGKMDRTEDAAEHEGYEWNQPSVSERVDSSYSMVQPDHTAHRHGRQRRQAMARRDCMPEPSNHAR